MYKGQRGDRDAYFGRENRPKCVMDGCERGSAGKDIVHDQDVPGWKGKTGERMGADAEGASHILCLFFAAEPRLAAGRPGTKDKPAGK